MKNTVIILLLLIVCSPKMIAQSKKDLKVKLMLVQSQVDQLKSDVQKLQAANSRLQQKLDSCSEDSPGVLKEKERVDTTEVDRLKEKVKQLQEQLYQTRISQAEKKLPDNLKKRNHVVKSINERHKLAEIHSHRLLSNCLRFNNPQRMFSEEILLDYEINPVNNHFSGFIRKRYIPEIGSDHYGFQKVEGKVFSSEEFLELRIKRIGDRTVNINVKCGYERDLYNEVNGDESDLTAFDTSFGNIKQFSLESCRHP